jgi:ATP-dependent DNA helicase RecG
MVVQYLRKYGRITRREVGELCKLGEFQAGRLLKRMLDRGELQLVGAGRGAYYELPK